MRLRDVDLSCISLGIATVFGLVFPLAARWILLGVFAFLAFSIYVWKET